jgi:predicted NBD/HSP70 family sugar kinase
LNTTLIRQLNTARVFHALREHPEISQRELAQRTGLDKATVSAVVNQLASQGLVTRQKRSQPGRVGRPEVALRLSERAGLFVGARLEPRTIRLVAARLDGKPLASLQVEGSTSLETAIAQLERAVRALVTRCGFTLEKLKGLGVGIPALMDLHGHLTLAPNLGWRDEPIRSRLEAHFDVPLYLDNDTKAAALAEKLFGACRDVRDFIFVAGHSGVGGGLYLGGSLYRGFSGYAGEVGHIKLVPNGRACGCGGRGCLEAYTSEAAILTRLAEAGAAFDDLWQVAAAAERGEARVQAVLQETGELLGRALALLVNLLNPKRIVLGGNLAIVAPYTLAAIETTLAREALDAPRQAAELIVSPLGAESVPMGGVALAMEGFLALPSWLRSP